MDNNNRTPAHLALALADARANNYALGVKLVRGAYHPHEIAAHRAAAANDDAHPSMSISPDVEPPVWMEKRETDEAFNGCLKVLINSVKEDVKRCEEETNEGYVKVLLKMATEDVERSKKAVGHTTVVEKSKKGWFGWFTSRGASNTDIKENESAATEADKELKTTLPAPSIGVLFGTHNWTSCGLILKNLVDAGLAVTSDGQEFKPEAADVVRISDMAVERIAIGQLYGAFVRMYQGCLFTVVFFCFLQKGMRDDLTDWVVKNTVSNTPFVIK
jgi:proline dehydrogenase